MPYIAPEDRFRFNMPTAENPGELNYLITTILDNYLLEHELCYTTMNEIIGVLECAKIEFYRRITVPYEDSKIFENGDVYSEENIAN